MKTNVISPVGFQGKLSKAEKRANRKQTAKALLLSNGAQIATIPVSLLAAKKMIGYSRALTPEQITAVNAGADKALSELARLNQNGVKIIDLNGGQINPTKLPDFIYGLIDPVFATSKGDNAFFTSSNKLKEFGIGGNSIAINREKLPLAVFHEMGHAHNFNNSKFLRLLQKTRMPGLLIGTVFALIPALTKEEVAKEGEELTKAQKFKNKFRKACPILAGLSMTPTFIEEAVATIKGNNWAKQLLNKDLAKKVAKSNAVALATYGITVLAAVLMGYVALKVKDKNNKPKTSCDSMHQGRT